MIFTRVLVRWALILTCGALASPRPPLDLEPPLALQAIDAPPPDAETYNYLLPRLASKYRPSLSWGGVADPRLYVLTELENLQNNDDAFRAKRKQPSLSIVNPMDVLRQRLLLEIARKQMKENEMQAVKNRVLLQNVGKRNAFAFEKNYDNYKTFEKRGLFSKLSADLDLNNERQQQQLQKDDNDFFSSGTNNL